MQAIQKALPIGIDDFKEMIEKEYYYIDKTLLIKEIIDNQSKVSLFTRPRRFGKTLAQSMIRYYFEKLVNQKGENVDNRQLFKGMEIMSAGKKYTDKMGEYPVISLTLKSAKQGNFTYSFAQIVEVISEEFDRHKEILEGNALSKDEKTRYQNFILKKAEDSEVFVGLKFLSRCLYKYYQQKVVILIDEYDVPLENAYFRGFYQEMIEMWLMGNILVLHRQRWKNY